MTSYGPVSDRWEVPLITQYDIWIPQGGQRTNPIAEIWDCHGIWNANISPQEKKSGGGGSGPSYTERVRVQILVFQEKCHDLGNHINNFSCHQTISTLLLGPEEDWPHGWLCVSVAKTTNRTRDCKIQPITDLHMCKQSNPNCVCSCGSISNPNCMVGWYTWNWALGHGVRRDGVRTLLYPGSQSVQGQGAHTPAFSSLY